MMIMSCYIHTEREEGEFLCACMCDKGYFVEKGESDDDEEEEEVEKEKEEEKR